jgi:hypothetical protein
MLSEKAKEYLEYKKEQFEKEKIIIESKESEIEDQILEILQDW